MMSGYKLSNEDIAALLTENSKKAIETFLTFYAANSHSNVRSSINRLLYHALSKDDVSEVDFQDYKKAFGDQIKSLSTQESLSQSFFRFLYAFDYLSNPDGFEKIWIKETVKRQFKKGIKHEEVVKVTKRRKTLNIEELLEIQEIFDADSTKFSTLKMQFCWYTIFELGLEIEDVRNTTYENFSNGKLYIGETAYEIPEKFHAMFKVLSQQDRVNNGFASLDVIIDSLGQLANLDRKLLPMTIKNTRKVYMITCGHCGEDQTNLSSNWLSVNNRIVCVACADMLKKKDFEVDVIQNENIDVNDDEQNDLTILFGYDDLKRQIQSKPIDYLKLHELQIEIGKLGEAFVYKFECEKLYGTNYMHKVDETKALVPANGFDILSYTRDGTPLHIEVKATTGTIDYFYLSTNELSTAERMKEEGLIYLVYFVKEIMSDNPKLTIIEDVSENVEYVREEINWKVSKKTNEKV